MSESDLAQEYAIELKTTRLAAVRREWERIKAMSLAELTSLNGRNKLGCSIVDHYFLG